MVYAGGLFQVFVIGAGAVGEAFGLQLDDAVGNGLDELVVMGGRREHCS